MRLKLTIMTLLLAFGMGAWAQESADDAKIIVWLKDGAKAEVLFNQMPEFLYADGNLILQNSDTELSWPLEKLDKFTFEGMGSSTPTNIQYGNVKAKLDIANGCSVYDLSGKLIKKEIRSLKELPAGTYIVKDGSVTFKVVRK